MRRSRECGARFPAEGEGHHRSQGSCGGEQILTMPGTGRRIGEPAGERMVGSSGRRWSGWLAAAALSAVSVAPASSRPADAPGEQLVALYRLPPEKIARYAAMGRGQSAEDGGKIESMFADRSPWVGPEHRAGAGRNPYTLVLTVSGVARAAGDVHSQWQAGWELIESPVASRELLLSLSALARKGVSAGQPLTLSARSAPVSFRGERQVAPMLGLVQARNLEIREVQVEVWSGGTPWAVPALPALPLALTAATVLALLAFVAWRAQRRDARAATADSEDDEDLPPLSSEAPPPPFRPTASHDLRVFESLHDVLHDGLVVGAQHDESRPRQRRTHDGAGPFSVRTPGP